MGIVKRQKVDGVWLGYDDERDEWVPVDAEFHDGTLLGNAIKSAYSESERIGLGLRQAVGSDVEDELAISDREREARRSAAPSASFLGEIAPDVGVGLGVGALTSGAGLLPMLGAEALSGAFMGGSRPGSVEERLENAAWAAGGNVIGAGLTSAASRGIMKALEVGRGLTKRVSLDVARGIDAAKQNASVLTPEEIAAGVPPMSAAERAGLTPETAPGAAVDDAAALPGGRSAGAMETPSGLLDEQTRAMNDSVVDIAPTEDAMLARAKELGYREPWYAGAGNKSAAKRLAAVDEFNPFKEIAEGHRTELNEALKPKLVAKAIGLADTNENQYSKLMIPDLEAAETKLDEAYDGLREVLPDIPMKDFADATSSIRADLGPLGDPKADKLLREMEENARTMQGDVKPQTYMRMIRSFQRRGAQFSKAGDDDSADLMHEAVEQLHKLVGKRIDRMAEEGGLGSSKRGKYVAKIQNTWAEMRRRSNMLRMLKVGGVVGKDGSINSTSLVNQMMKAPSKGGFGMKGPPPSSGLRDIWDVATVDAGSGTGVPATGVRLAGLIGRRGMQYGGGGAALLSGGNALSGLFD